MASENELQMKEAKDASMVEDASTIAEPSTVAEPSTADAIATAVRTIDELCAQLRCDACKAGLVSKLRPWRSCNCEHRLCANCASSARGTLANRVTDGGAGAAEPPPKRRASASRSGLCPVQSCQIPVRPAEIVHDLPAWHITLACNALKEWAEKAQKIDQPKS